MKVILDRFEGDYAVVELEDKSMIDMPKVLLPKGVKEGDVIEIRVDRKETESRKNRIQQLMKDLWEDK